jgi:DNA repair exonuclease SbcCD ATPase subunit
MITFEKLTLRNFLSYGNVPTDIDLINSDATLIQGQNGTGKTTIAAGVVYAAYNKTLNPGTTADDLINNINGKNMSVSVIFHKAEYGYYKIERCRKMKPGAEGNYVKLFYNKDERVFENQHNISLDSIKNTDQLIIDILGISYDMFVQMVLILATNTDFLDLPVTATNSVSQQGFIERLFDLHILNEKAVALKASISETKKHIDKQEFETTRIIEEQQRLDNHIANIRRKSENHADEVQKTIYHYKKELSKIDGVDVDAEKKYLSMANIVRGEIKTIKTEASSVSSNKDKIDRLKQKTIQELDSLQKSICPRCKQHYHNEDDIQNCVTVIEECDKTLSESIEKLAELDDSMVKHQDEHDKLLASITVDDIEELINIKNRSENIKQKIEELHNSKNVYLEQLAELEEMKLEPADFKGLDKLKNILYHQEFLVKLLTKKDSFIRKNLLDSNLKYLNSRLQKYLQDMKMPYMVEFNANMTADIRYLGRSIKFSNLSNGQRGKISLGLIFAFRDIRQKMSSPINLCIMDEILDTSLDTNSVLDAVALLKMKAREDNMSLFLISHRSETIDMFEKVMYISTENDFSKISYN